MNLLRRFHREQLPVLKAMPDHVKNVSLNMGLLFLQMEHTRQHRSPSVNVSPYQKPTKDVV